MCVFFLFTPIIGYACILLTYIVYKVFPMAVVNRDALVVQCSDVPRRPEHPNIEEALNTVPVKDAMAISDNEDKRGLLLKQLKKNMIENYKTLLVAQKDDDSESAHYVASVKMEIYRINQERWLECRKEYFADTGNCDKYHKVCEVLNDMLNSGVLSSVEINLYRQKLCSIIEKWVSKSPSEISPQEWSWYIRCLVDLGMYDDAEKVWNLGVYSLKEESAHI